MMNVSTIPVEWLPQYTYTDYESWEGDWELIYGLPYAMSPSAKRTHQATGKKFIQLIEKGLSDNKSGCDCESYYELDWIVNENTVIRPDIMIVCGKFEDDFLRFPPTLIVEIASSKTRVKRQECKVQIV
jgi:Uma2 family endonuclease